MRNGPVGAYAPRSTATRDTYFGELLMEFRVERNLTHYRLAKRSGVSSGYISRLEHGERYPSGKVVEGLIIALELRNLQANALRMAAGYAPRQKALS